MEIAAQTQGGLHAAGSRLDRLVLRWRSLFGATARKGTLALVDQAVVSGTNFFTTVIVGRICGPDELGAFSLAFGLLVLVTSVQESLISAPYTVYANRLARPARSHYAGSALVQQAVLSALAMIGLALAGALVWLGIGPPRLEPVIWVLAAVIPFMLLREFGRRLAFAHLRMATALALDLAVAMLQIGGLIWAAALSGLSAAGAQAVVGLACAVVAVTWLALAQANFAVRREQLSRDWGQNWLFGRWVFAGRVTSSVHAYAVHWWLALALGTAATGEFAAAMTVVLLCNPLILGFSNVLAPRAARAFAEGGRREVRRVIWKAALLLTIGMAAFCGLVMLWGSRVVALLYGSSYATDWQTIAALALGVLANALGVAADHGLCTLERPDVNFKAGVSGLAATLVTAALVVRPWGVFGAACSLLVGCITAAGVRCAVFARLAGGRT